MPAPQQTSVPTYKETSNIPKPSVAYYLHQQGSGPAAGLSRLLGVASKRAKVAAEDNKPSPEENLQLAALAQMGAERDRLKLSKGKSLFGFGNNDVQMDAYELERGRREAAILAGQLRDAYAEAGLHMNDDPKAYQGFVDGWQTKIFEEILADVDPAFHHGFITQIGPVFQNMGMTHAGNLDTFIQSKNKLATENLIDQQVNLEMTMERQGNAFNVLMDNLMGSESNNNYNAFHNNADNTTIRFTDMTLAEIAEFQTSKRWAELGAGSSAVGRYQMTTEMFRETVRASGLDPNTTKFTPAVQDRLAFTRLVTTRDFAGFLNGKYTAEEYLDQHLQKEWAGLKGTNGRGFYDGDGVNKASLPAQKSVAALMAFREAYVRDPSIVKKDKNGKVIGLAEDAPVPSSDPTRVASVDGGSMVDGQEVGPDAPTPPMRPQRLAETLATSPEKLGVNTPEARKIAAKALVNFLKKNPDHAERIDLEDMMSSWALPKADREFVYETRDAILEERKVQAELDQEAERRSSISQFDQAVRSGDFSVIEDVPEVYAPVLTRLKGVMANPPEVDVQYQTQFLEHVRSDEAREARATPSHKDYPQYVLSHFMHGKIDQDTYIKAMNLHDVAIKASKMKQKPGLEPYANTLLDSLPKGKFRADFKEAMDTILADFADSPEGPPPLLEVFQALNQLHETTAAKLAEAHQRILGDPTYQ